MSYPDMLQAAETELGTMFDRREYPTQSELARRYGFEFDVSNVPTTGDFRVELPDVDRNRLVRIQEEATNRKLREATSELVERITETVGRMSERLRAYKGTREGAFRDTLVTNVEDLVAIIPALNITGDPRLTAIAQQMRRDLCGQSAELLRESPKTRETVAENADAILKQVQQLMA